MVYIGNDVVYSCSTWRGWMDMAPSIPITSTFSLKCCHTIPKKERFQNKTKKALEELFHQKGDNRLSAVGSKP